MAEKAYLAIDMGASSGRHVLGRFDGRKLSLEEVYRFENGPVQVAGSLHWDLLALWSHVCEGLRAAAGRGETQVASVGVDTWGVDFGLLGRDDVLLGNPYHYRDSRTNGMQEKAFSIVGREEIFRHTGLQFMQFNTLYQLLAMKLARSPLLDVAESLLMIPDLFHWLLTGVKCNESRMQHLVAEHFADDEAIWRDDCIEFFLDADHDHATFWQFITNPAGARYDAEGKDRGWGCPWKVAIQKTPKAWHVEAAVLFEGLGVASPKPGAVWGFNLARERMAGGGRQLYNWADVQVNFLNPDLFGHLWFVGATWTPTPEAVAGAARLIEGAEARVFAPGGYWVAREGQPPTMRRYQDLLREKQRHLEQDYLVLLRKIYAANPAMPHHGEFEQLDGRYRAIEKLALTEGDADAEACAAAQGFLEGVEDQVARLYWLARLEQLDREY